MDTNGEIVAALRGEQAIQAAIVALAGELERPRAYVYRLLLREALQARGRL